MADSARNNFGAGAFVVVIGLSTFLNAGPAQSETCALPLDHFGVTFPIEKVDPDWACRLQAIIDHYTIANKLGRSEPVYLKRSIATC